MRIRAIGTQTLVRANFELIDAVEKQTNIAIPREVIDKLKGGCQISEVLSVGESVFDTESPPLQSRTENNTQGMDWIGRQVLTSRYPGHSIDFDPLATDAQVASVRMISCDEVHAVLALDDEEGADV